MRGTVYYSPVIRSRCTMLMNPTTKQVATTTVTMLLLVPMLLAEQCRQRRPCRQRRHGVEQWVEVEVARTKMALSGALTRRTDPDRTESLLIDRRACELAQHRLVATTVGARSRNVVRLGASRHAPCFVC